ncbi:uncharacterized protein C5orf34 homolog isoform X1 [Diceros bicornis minor]|uniref:uncharacterized protein C5orf34 homolog isoform X1 n=1 Tax=Diceros bicornis minor TaxID=77932 RepID=UPI0026EF8EE3|nr:uncharacterized protein C5orf34 homolog isoform X1 [Diceros bicornis minor]XP_058420110.1 uncharacterized protein C5orf34 homolog isoform X1 [Diceros bicornis minor]XP_058420111.1 uncharacterized protein C5orf34 homolog isoform X1 [Diceros bicornis minor]
MAAEVRMVLYEDDSVQVQYVDGSRLQLSPCGSEFLFEKAPPVSAHPLEQPERIRQRTQFVISTYREQLQRALDFRNSSATCPFLSESIIPSEKKKRIFIDISEVRWPSLDTDDGMICMQSGTVKISSLDGHAYLCLPKSQHEFTVHFLCKVSQKPDSSRVLSEKNNPAKKDKLVEKAGKIRTYGNLSGQRLKNKENELHCQILKPKEPLEKKSCVNGTKGREELPLPATNHTCVYTWVKQRWSVASCPEEWKYPLSLALHFHNKISNISGIDANITLNRILTSDVSEERGKEVSVLPRALLLSCPVPHLHRWNFCDSLSQRQSDEEEYSYPEPVKVVWYKGITYRLTHKNVNSIEIYPGDGSIFKSEGAYFGNYFTYYSIQEGSEEREEKTYSVNNLPPDRPGSLFSVRSLMQQATRILQHCVKMRLSLSHNYRICCWKMLPGINDSTILPVLLRESLIPTVGRFLAYSDDKVHAVFLDGITLTLNWNFGSFIENRQVNRGLQLGWCKLTFPDGQDQFIQIGHPGPHERYVTTVISWCRRLTQTSQREMPTHPSSSVLEENWSVASELDKIQKFNLLLESSGILNQTAKRKNEQSSDHYKPQSSETFLEEVNEKRVSVALKKTSEILRDIDCLLSNSKK